MPVPLVALPLFWAMLASQGLIVLVVILGIVVTTQQNKAKYRGFEATLNAMIAKYKNLP